VRVSDANREHIAIVGDGQMALVLADALAARRAKTTVISPFAAEAARLAVERTSVRLPGFRLPDGVEVTAETRALHDATLVVCAIPTQFIRATFARLAPDLRDAVPLVSVAKGIEVSTFKLPCDILREACSVHGRSAPVVAALSGPTIAAELARRLPAALVAASPDAALSSMVSATFSTQWMRIYQSPDIVGVELAGACKNVVAIAAGVVDGMGLGMNAKSALLARGLSEIARIGVALGGRMETFFGVAGAGDLATTCFAPEGRNRSFGERLARGETAEAILAQMTSVVEGVPTSRALVRVARERGIELPICETVERMVFESLPPREALASLMSRATSVERIG
jgi:glycerol-3-phosphate dehydrogenase (NAD(P)+)